MGLEKKAERWKDIALEIIEREKGMFEKIPGRRRLKELINKHYNGEVVTENDVRNFMEKHGIKGTAGSPLDSVDEDSDYIDEIIGEETETPPFFYNEVLKTVETVNLGFLYPYEASENETPLRYRIDLVFMEQHFPKNHEFDLKLQMETCDSQGKLHVALFNDELKKDNLKNGVFLLILSPCLSEAMEYKKDDLSPKWVDTIDQKNHTVPVAYPLVPYKNKETWNAIRQINFNTLKNAFDKVNSKFNKEHPLHPKHLKKTIEEHPEMLFMIRDKVIELEPKINKIKQLEDINYKWELDIVKIYTEIFNTKSNRGSLSILKNWHQYYKEYLEFKYQKGGENKIIINETHRSRFMHLLQNNIREYYEDRKTGELYNNKIKNLKKRGVFSKAIPLGTYFPHTTKEQGLFRLCIALCDGKIKDYIKISKDIRKHIYPNYDAQPIFEPSPGFIQSPSGFINYDESKYWGLASVKFKLRSDDDAMVFFVRGCDIYRDDKDNSYIKIFIQTPLLDALNEAERNKEIIQLIEKNIQPELWQRIEIYDDESIQYSSLPKGMDLYKTISYEEIEREYNARKNKNS